MTATTTQPPSAPRPGRPAPVVSTFKRPRKLPAWVSRLIACLAGGVVLAMMVGPQEGTTSDYYYSFHQAVLAPRIVVFLGIGLLLFLAITFWPNIKPYLTRTGFWPLISGALAVLASITLMDWYDLVGDKKFPATADAVAKTASIDALASAFFSWLAWAQLIVLLIAGSAAIITEKRWLKFTVAGLCVVAAGVTWWSHNSVVSAGGGADHSLGYAVSIFGYLVMLVGLIAAAVTDDEENATKELAWRVLGFRPGLPLVVLGLLASLIAFLGATWFSPTNKNVSFLDASNFFSNAGLAPLATQYLAWLGWGLLVVTIGLNAVAAWTRNRVLGWIGAVIGIVASVLTLVAVYQLSKLGAKTAFDGATGPWQNLGSGAWLATAGLFLAGGGGYIAATAPPPSKVLVVRELDVDQTPEPSKVRRATTYLSAPGAARSAIMVAIAVALFYPPTATPFWQQVLVTDIGVAMLLAVGLNVVVGWAGLLDLGFIAFYAIGSYTTAYLVGALPVKPPSWLQMSPLLATPFAIGVCLLAGLALGAPTLRLRGDYLAIVTLGFGEIIHLAAINLKGVTNGSEGTTTNAAAHTTAIPHPSIHIGPIHVRWGLAQLQYWYLLLVILLIIVIAFWRLENSRLGRQWAAVREDEVAAQSSGINTTKVKLLAFAIGASTSGFAGVFFASQIGTFTPDNFVLNNSIVVLAYVVFGGMGSIPGALAGAAALTWLPQFLREQVPPSDKLMWIGAMIILMMIFRPQGLIPERRRATELSHFQQASSSEVRAVPIGEGLG